MFYMYAQQYMLKAYIISNDLKRVGSICNFNNLGGEHPVCAVDSGSVSTGVRSVCLKSCILLTSTCFSLLPLTNQRMFAVYLLTCFEGIVLRLLYISCSALSFVEGVKERDLYRFVLRPQIYSIYS